MGLNHWVWTLVGGCVITVAVWTGGDTLIQAGTKLTEYSEKIVQYELNENKLVEALNKQKEIYLSDTGKYKSALEKANSEINKANQAAVKLQVEIDKSIKDTKDKAPLTTEQLNSAIKLVNCQDTVKGSDGEGCSKPKGEDKDHEGDED